MEWKQLIDPVLWVIAAVIGAVYLFIPLTNDARIYLGVEHIAAAYYPFPQGIDIVWEIKPVANRLTNYFLYEIATHFVPFNDHFLFGVAVKILALLAIIAVAWYFSRVIGGKYTFLLVFLSFTAIANFCVLQAEYWAVLLALLAIAMIVSNSRLAWFAAGALIVWIFLLKGITGLLMIPILCGAYLLLQLSCEHDPWFFRLFILPSGFVAGIAAFISGWLLWWPHAVSDMLLSSQLARVGSVGPINLAVWFIAQFILSPLYMPVLLIGIIFGAIFFFAWVRYQDTGIRVAYELMWVVPVIIVMMQGEMFLYHYLAFIPTAIVTIVLCERNAA